MPADARQLVGELHRIDGATVRTRPIQASDMARLQAFHVSLSPETIELRFFGALPVLPEQMAEHFTHVDYAGRMALLATIGEGDDERILAVGRYDRIGPAEAEVAFVVSDARQGHGIATALLFRLAGYARAHGITTFVAYVLEGNTRMLDVFHHSGYPCTAHASTGEFEVRLDIRNDPSPQVPQCANRRAGGDCRMYRWRPRRLRQATSALARAAPTRLASSIQLDATRPPCCAAHSPADRVDHAPVGAGRRDVQPIAASM